MASANVTGRLIAVSPRPAGAMGWALAALSWQGYAADRADSAETALRMLRSARYDVMLLEYNSSQEDIQLSVDLLQDPDARIPTLILMNDEEEFVTPPQNHFVPTAYLEPGFTDAELFHLVEQLKQYRR